MNILLVDDDAICNLISRKILEKMGVPMEGIHIALNGAEAIHLLNHDFDASGSLPDFILLDLNMPVMDGFGFLEAFHKLPISHLEKIKVIVLSSSGNPDDIDRARSLGVENYITKPITVDKLASAFQTMNDN